MSVQPDTAALYDVLAQTWPARSTAKVGPWVIRDGGGGGKRVSSATLEGPFEALDQAIDAMRDLGQSPQIMVRAGEEALDAELEARGFARVDPVEIYTCPVSQLTDVAIPRVTAFTIWEPLHIMYDIWASGGITAARIDVMRRCTLPKTALLSRWNDQPAGAGFVAIHDGVAMVHALEILPHQRGLGVGQWMMRRAADWAEQNGAQYLSVVCTEENAAAKGLYRSLGMDLIGRYHYRTLES